MTKRAGRGPETPLFGAIPADLVDAKESLRDRLFLAADASLPRARALRRARRFHPAPGVNVVGVGIGEKVTEGRRTGELCVKVLVARKYPRGRIRRSELIPPAIAGIRTDVEGVGYPRKLAILQRQRHRPVPGGVSVGLDFHAVSYRFAGTLGVVVRDHRNGRRLCALSNNHVLADENRVSEGAGVVQPGTLDGGRNADRVARLTRVVPLRFENRRNWMDAAIAQFDQASGVARTILGIGPPAGSATPRLHALVRKSGRTTGVTEGVVRVVRFDVVNVEYDQGMVRVDDVIVIEGTAGAFSKAGDSGSAIVDAQGRVVALLFAGSDEVTYAIPIGRILRRLEVRIAT
ncbi:MAG: trypsin-like peptidase domain-containing protein [Candidatus Rokubacteria bacterium]|nr:trypsin-like peptidase domain-containing protein [Candidatus Rokubacteria bacterium]